MKKSQNVGAKSAFTPKLKYNSHKKKINYNYKYSNKHIKTNH